MMLVFLQNQCKLEWYLQCEPGIYIPEENLGIRLEKILITATGNDDLMKNIPLEADEIEALMANK
jgi:Xaa-Pro aminopeptidase